MPAGKALYSLFHEGKEVTTRDLEGIMAAASDISGSFFIHQFGTIVDFNLRDKLESKLKEHIGKTAIAAGDSYGE